MKIGFHSPLPPVRSGVADYSAALIGILREHGEVVPNPEAPADVELYHLGNNQLHRAIYERALARPGVVVLHDALLVHFFLGSLDQSRFAEEFAYNYGSWALGLGECLWQNRARSGQDQRYFRYPMLRRIAETAHAVVVHNPGAAALVRQHAPGARIYEIPHLFLTPELPPPFEVARLRPRLGIPGGAILFGVFGYLRESKRLSVVLRAAERLRKAGQSIALLVAGGFASPDLERAIVPQLRRNGAIVTGHLTERDFWLHACAVDVCINLRHPTAGESSGIAVRLMGIGKPTILTASEENTELPEPACVKVDTGPAEVEMLAYLMGWLAESSKARFEVGNLAASHIRTHHDARRCGEKYWQVLRICAGAEKHVGAA